MPCLNFSLIFIEYIQLNVNNKVNNAHMHVHINICKNLAVNRKWLRVVKPVPNQILNPYKL